MPMSAARKRANDKWNDANLKERSDHIHLTAPKGFLDEVKAAAQEAGESVNGYIKESVIMRMQKKGQA